MLLEARNVSFRYGKRGPWVLRGVSMRVESGERVGVVAPSGFGKSTLMRIVAGCLEPSAGCVLLDGRPLPRSGVCPVQLIHQHPEQAVNPRWKMRQVLEEAGTVRGELLDMLGIERDWLSRYPRELSGGELQRFCVARALSPDASFLLADEMSTMLDAITQAQIWGAVLQEAVSRGIGLVVVSHNRALAERVCDRIVDLGEGVAHLA